MHLKCGLNIPNTNVHRVVHKLNGTKMVMVENNEIILPEMRLFLRNKEINS